MVALDERFVMEFPSPSVALISFAFPPIGSNPLVFGIDVVSAVVTDPGVVPFHMADAGRVILNPETASEIVPPWDGVIGAVTGRKSSARAIAIVPTDRFDDPKAVMPVLAEIYPSTAILSFPFPNPAGTSVISKAPPVPTRISFPNHFVFSVPSGLYPSKLAKAFFPESSVEPFRVPEIMIVETIGFREMFPRECPVPETIPVNARLGSYPGLRTTASYGVPDAILILKVPPVFVFAQKTCFLLVSRISTKASETGMPDPLAVTAPVTGVDF